MQEPSAMFTVNCYNFKGDEYVLDMCAAPGGKTIQLANRVKNGLVVSNEFVKSRSEILYSNVERMGLKNVVITNEKPENLAQAYANSFDVCLVDAPCSGEGMFRRGQDVVDQWNEKSNEMCAVRQLEILEQANACLKTGGHLIYSTCTYSQLENEGVVQEFMKKHNYELLHITADFSRGIDMPEVVRLYPHKVKGEGQFVALLKKKEENTLLPYRAERLRNSSFAQSFVKQHTNLNITSYEYKNYSYYVKDTEMIKKHVNYVSVGVRLGSFESNRFEPHHYMFSAFGRDFNLSLNYNLSDANVLKYLKGETLEVDMPDGFGCLKIEGCPVGGFKISRGKFKNYYPKGLRNFK